jgi:hypothetical protein
MAPKLKVEPRDVGPALQMLRNFLLGRKWKHVGQLRYQEMMSPRPGPQPVLPDGPTAPNAMLSASYYYSRDARRNGGPPKLISSGQKQLASGTEGSAVGRPNMYISSAPFPGKPYIWEEVK